MRTLPLLAALSLLAPVSASGQDTCAYDRNAMLALDIGAFDSTLNRGWRLVGDRKGCEAAAADLMAAYRNAHAVALANGPIDRLRGLIRHESQLRAAAGQIDEAVRLRVNARETGDQSQQFYDDATIAFLKKDRRGLDTARTGLAALPKPAWFEVSAAQAKARYGMTVTWPPNLAVVDGLARCFDRPYAEAYGMACRQAAEK